MYDPAEPQYEAIDQLTSAIGKALSIEKINADVREEILCHRVRLSDLNELAEEAASEVALGTLERDGAAAALKEITVQVEQLTSETHALCRELIVLQDELKAKELLVSKILTLTNPK